MLLFWDLSPGTLLRDSDGVKGYMGRVGEPRQPLQPVSLAESGWLHRGMFWGVLFSYAAICSETTAVAVCGSLCFLLVHRRPPHPPPPLHPPVLMGPPTFPPEVPTGACMSPSNPLCVEIQGVEKYSEKCNQLLCPQRILKMSFVISIQVVVNMKEIMCMF